jgi:hypothetical protein
MGEAGRALALASHSLDAQAAGWRAWLAHGGRSSDGGVDAPSPVDAPADLADSASHRAAAPNGGVRE